MILSVPLGASRVPGTPPTPFFPTCPQVSLCALWLTGQWPLRKASCQRHLCEACVLGAQCPFTHPRLTSRPRLCLYGRLTLRLWSRQTGPSRSLSALSTQRKPDSIACRWLVSISEREAESSSPSSVFSSLPEDRRGSTQGSVVSSGGQTTVRTLLIPPLPQDCEPGICGDTSGGLLLLKRRRLSERTPLEEQEWELPHRGLGAWPHS